MESGLIHPLDWVAAACVAFGLCAGIARGFWHQFSRFLVWAGAILVGAFLRPILAHFFTGLDSEIPALRAEWGLCLLALPGFYLLRRWVFSWWESIAPETPSRIAGGFFGSITGLLVLLVWIPLLTWFGLLPKERDWEQTPKANVAVTALHHFGEILPEFHPKLLMTKQPRANSEEASSDATH